MQVNFLEYIRNIQHFIIPAGIVFLLASILGYVLTMYDSNILSGLLFDLVETAEKISTLPDWQMMLVIFLNNSIKIFIIAILGVFFGLVPAFFLFSNGLILGMVSFHVINENSLIFLLTGLLPHGVLEIPAAIIAAAIGFMLGKKAYDKIVVGEDNKLKKEIKKSSFFIIKFLIPIMFLASIIEVYITFALIN